MTRDRAISMINQYATLDELNDYPHGRALRDKFRDMARRIDEEDKGNGQKAMRWLGFIQGALWQELFSVDELKQHSRTGQVDPPEGNS